MRLSQSLNTTNQAAHDQATPPSVSNILPAPPPPPLEASESLPPPPPPPPSTPAGGLHIPSSTSIPPNAPPANIISRAAVRYQLPSAPAELPSSEAELADALRHEAENAPAEGAEGEGSKADPSAPRSLRPGQQGFAARLMSKYGWTKGSGLGADGSGIVNPLRVQMEKRKKRGDAEGGGFVGPAGKGKIIGSRRNVGPAEEQQEGRFGPMSEVVVLRGMVDGMDVGAEMGEGGLMQEIGDECSEKVSLPICEQNSCGVLAWLTTLAWYLVWPRRACLHRPRRSGLGAGVCQVHKSAVCSEGKTAPFPYRRFSELTYCAIR